VLRCGALVPGYVWLFLWLAASRWVAAAAVINGRCGCAVVFCHAVLSALPEADELARQEQVAELVWPSSVLLCCYVLVSRRFCVQLAGGRTLHCSAWRMWCNHAHFTLNASDVSPC
jgi:hypothetical protein